MTDAAPDDRPKATTTQADDARFAAELRAALAAGRAAGAIAAPAPLDDLLDRIVRAAARAVPSPEGALFLVDPVRRVLTFDVVIGKTAEAVRELTVPLGHGIAGLVAVSGQALAVANAQQDPRHAKDIAAASGYLPTTILAVPVASPDGTPVGVLELLDRQGQATYDLADMETLGAYAEQIAIVLEHRRATSALGSLLGRSLAALGGLPAEAERGLAERAAAFAASVERDEAAGRTLELAELVATVARRGPAAQQACLEVLRAFAGYLEATPGGGAGGNELEMPW